MNNKIVKNILLFLCVALSYFLFLPYVISFVYALLFNLLPNIFIGPFKLVEENVEFISLFIQDIGGLIIIGYFLFRIIKNNKLNEEKEKCFNLETLKQGAITLGLLYLVNIVITLLIPNLSTGANQENVNSIIQTAPILSFFSVVIIAPIVEEIIFRYLLVTPFFKNKKYIGIVLSALLFGSIHLVSSIQNNTLLADLPNLCIYAGMGAVLACQYVKTENIYVPILGHTFNNLLAYVASLFL